VAENFPFGTLGDVLHYTIATTYFLFQSCLEYDVAVNAGSVRKYIRIMATRINHTFTGLHGKSIEPGSWIA
jgi:hypothetical protein